MKKEINLLEATDISSEIEAKKKNKGIGISIGMLVIFGMLVVTIFVYLNFLDGKMKILSEKVMGKESEIEKMKDKESMYRVIKLKLKGADEIISKRADLIPVLDVLQNATPKGITFETISLPTADKLSLTGSAVNTTVLGDFFTTLTAETYSKYFRQITLNSLTYSLNRGYSFDIFILLVTKEKK